MEPYAASIIILNLWSVQPPHLDTKPPQQTEQIFIPIRSKALVKREDSYGSISRQFLVQILGALNGEHTSLVGISWSFAIPLERVHNSHLIVKAEPKCDLVLCTLAEPYRAASRPRPLPLIEAPCIVGDPRSNIQLAKLDEREYLNSMAANNNVKLISDRSAQNFSSLLRAIHHYKERVSSQSLDRRKAIQAPISYPSSRASTPSSCSDVFSGTESLHDLRSTMYFSEERGSPVLPLRQRESSVGSSSVHSWQIVDASKSPSPHCDAIIKQEDGEEFEMIYQQDQQID